MLFGIKYIDNRLLIVFALLCLLAGCKTDDKQDIDPKEDDLETRLNAIPGFTVTSVSGDGPLGVSYRIEVTQPIDHNNPNGPTFKQQVILNHRGDFDPVILNTNGYGTLSFNSLIGHISGNSIAVQHRYFGQSKPDILDWQYLTVEQAAADHHKIVESLKTIYHGKWISTGISKGGMSALFHKRFYPDDVDATVAYVAPISLDLPDTRYEDFLSALGSTDCRKRLLDFQRLVLQKRESIIQLLVDYQENRDELSFSFTNDQILEYAVTWYPFLFWQWRSSSGCIDIPTTASSNQQIFDHLNEVSTFSDLSDGKIKALGPYYYQAYTQLGSPQPNISGIEEMLIAPTSLEELLMASIGSQFVPNAHNDAPMRDIAEWLNTSGNNIIYIYGSNDPWTAGAVNPETGTNALKIVQPGENHGVTIYDLDDRELVLSTLENWLEISIN